MENQSPAAILKTLKTIHWALIIGISLFASVVAYQLGVSGDTTLINTEQLVVFIPLVLASSVIPAALILFNRQLKNLRHKKDLNNKLLGYQTAHIIKMAMLEGVGLFAIVACFVTYSTINFFVFALVVILMAGNVPTAFRLEEKLGLTRDEAQQLRA